MQNEALPATEITAKVLETSKRDALRFAVKENEDLQNLAALIALKARSAPATLEGQFLYPAEVLDSVVELLGSYVERRAIALESLNHDFKFAEAIHESAVKQHKGEKFH